MRKEATVPLTTKRKAKAEDEGGDEETSGAEVPKRKEKIPLLTIY
jgi:hypothetical protein